MKKPGLTSSNEYKEKYKQNQEMLKAEKEEAKAKKEADAQAKKAEKAQAKLNDPNYVSASDWVKGVVNPVQNIKNIGKAVKGTAAKIDNKLAEEAAAYKGQPKQLASVAPKAPSISAGDFKAGAPVDASIPSADNLSPEDVTTAEKVTGITDNDNEITASDKWQNKMLESGMFKLDKNGSLVPVAQKPQIGWPEVATGLSIAATIVGAMFGVPIPAINFMKLTGSDEARQLNQKTYNDAQSALLEQYNKLNEARSNAELGQDTINGKNVAQEAGKTAYALGGGKATFEDQFAANKEIAQLNNTLQQQLHEKLATLSADQQAKAMQSISDWVMANPKNAAVAKTWTGLDQLVNAVSGLSSILTSDSRMKNFKIDISSYKKRDYIDKSRRSGL